MARYTPLFVLPFKFYSHNFSGSNCSSPLNKPCDPNSPNYIVSNISTGLYVNPSTYYTYMSPGKTALALKLNVDMSSAPTKLDVLLLVDVTKSITANMFSFLLENYAKTFFGNVRAQVTNSYFAVATFTDQPAGPGCSSQDYPFRLHLPLSSVQVPSSPSPLPPINYSLYSQGEFVSALGDYLKPNPNLGCDDSASKLDSQLDALYLASAASVGWRADAFHIAVVITDSASQEGAGYSSGSVYANRLDTMDALIQANVLPLILAPSGFKSSYETFLNKFGFGLFTAIATDYSTVFTVANTQIGNLMKQLSTSVNQDTYGFVTSVSKKETGITFPANKIGTVNMKYPNVALDTIPNYPEIGITMMGWGTATIVAQGSFH